LLISNVHNLCCVIVIVYHVHIYINTSTTVENGVCSLCVINIKFYVLCIYSYILSTFDIEQNQSINQSDQLLFIYNDTDTDNSALTLPYLSIASERDTRIQTQVHTHIHQIRLTLPTQLGLLGRMPSR